MSRRPDASAPQASAPDASTPHYIESLAGALIDSARISVMAAIAMLPAPPAPLIVLPGPAAPRGLRRPGTPEQMADDAAATPHGCLEEAMQWLNAARVHTAGELAAKGVPPTSLHEITPAGVR